MNDLDLIYFSILDNKKKPTNIINNYDTNSNTYYYPENDFDELYDPGKIKQKGKKRDLAITIIKELNNGNKLIDYFKIESINEFKLMLDIIKQKLEKKSQPYKY